MPRCILLSYGPVLGWFPVGVAIGVAALILFLVWHRYGSTFWAKLAGFYLSLVAVTCTLALFKPTEFWPEMFGILITSPFSWYVPSMLFPYLGNRTLAGMLFLSGELNVITFSG